MKILKKLMVFALIILNLSYITLDVNAENDYTDYFTYPTIEYLNSLDTMQERYAACNVELETLRQLSDEQLIKAIEEYPYLLDIYAFSTIEEGYEILKTRFNGMIELENRDIELTNTYNVATYGLTSLRKEATASVLSLHPGDLGGGGSGSITAVYTPNGYLVSVYVISSEMTAARIAELDDYVETTYPNTVIVRSATQKYNCHSYAWYSQSSSNNYWMNDPSAYMKYGAYTERTSTTSISTLDKVFYDNGSLSSNHSGIVYSTGTLSSMYLVSKWGKCGLIRHKIKDSPYTVDSDYGNISFWY